MWDTSQRFTCGGTEKHDGGKDRGVLCICVCVEYGLCLCGCREKLVVQGETGQMGMRDVSVCKENRRVFSWCIKRWVCECFGETG